MAESSVPQHVATFTMGVFLSLVFVAIGIVSGFSVSLLAIVGGILAFAFAYRYIYVALYAALASALFTGITVSISTGNLQFGERAFGGSIDITLAEFILFFVLAAWAAKLFFYWWKRKDTQWLPRLPLVGSYLALFAAHVLSIFSPLQPDPILALKYAVRPVLFQYLAFVALPINLLRSRRRLLVALVIMAGVGSLAALNGLFAMFFDPTNASLIARAHPLSVFGVSPLGENYNELADLLVFTTFATLAAARLVKSELSIRWCKALAVFQFGIGLLTFTRTAWICFALQGAFLYWSMWRAAVRKHLRVLCAIGLLCLPLVVGMLSYAASDTASSSNSTRLMLSQIALELFVSSPVFGAGAGTFVQQVGSTHVFLLEYGDPLDSHGFIQKIAAETGSLGLLALLCLYLQLGLILSRLAKNIAATRAREAYFLLIAGTGGALVYQLFNTDYWSAKMWLPVGLTLAAGYVLKEVPRDILEP